MSVTRANRDLNELHPVVKKLAEQLLQKCKEQGLNIGISETYRSVERQDYLYAQGRTRPGRIVTYATGSSRSSYHQWRLAFDVYNNVRGAEYDAYVLQKVGKIGQSIGLEWGGAWAGFKDTPHFQYTFGLSIKELNEGKQPPTRQEDTSDKDDTQNSSPNNSQNNSPNNNPNDTQNSSPNNNPNDTQNSSPSNNPNDTQNSSPSNNQNDAPNSSPSNNQNDSQNNSSNNIQNNNPNTTPQDLLYSQAVEALIEAKIITTKEAWLPEPSTKYVEILIDRISKKLAKELSYEENIKRLEQNNIIGSPEVWLDKAYNETDVKWLIKKSAKQLKQSKQSK